MVIDFYNQGIDMANEHVTAPMMNFEWDDGYACLAFSAKKLIEIGFTQYDESCRLYEKKALGESKYASDPLLTNNDEDRLLGFCARASEIQKLSEDGYYYHKVRDPNKPGGWDYVLETAPSAPPISETKQ